MGEAGTYRRCIGVGLQALALALAPAWARAGDANPAIGVPLELTIETPEGGSVFGGTDEMGFVAGRALAHDGTFERLDIVLVIDRSASTGLPSGGDIDGDGVVGEVVGGDGPRSLFWGPEASTDEDDSVLSAELAAAGTLLEQLDPRATRVGVIAFSGDGDPSTPDVTVHAPLSSAFEHARAALAEIRRAGPEGHTNLSDAVRQAVLELTRPAPLGSEDRPAPRRVMMLLSDGQPTLPFKETIYENKRRFVNAAFEAGGLGIRIDAFSIGSRALEDPGAMMEVARLTGGVYTPVAEPDRLIAAFEHVNFSEIRMLEVTNRSHGVAARHLSRAADGSYAALIPLGPGLNVIEVRARASDGREQSRRVAVRLLANAPAQSIAPRLRAVRNRLLERRLAELQLRRVDLRAQLVDAARKHQRTQNEALRRNTVRRLDIEARELSREAAVRRERGE